MTDCDDSVWLESVPAGTPSALTYDELLAQAEFNFDARQITDKADGEALGTWPDEGPHGYDAAADAKYVWRNGANGINGEPAILANAGVGEIILPDAADNLANTAGGLTIFVIREGSAVDALIAKVGDPTNQFWEFNGFQGYVYTDPGAPIAAERAIGSSDADARIDLFRWDPGSLTAIYKDGVLLGSAAAPAASKQLGTQDVQLLSDGAFNVWVGLCGQIVGWTPSLGIADINTVLAGLSAAWSIAVTPLT